MFPTFPRAVTTPLARTGFGEAASDSSKSSQGNPPEAPSRQVLQLLLRVIADELSEVHDTKWGIKV